MSEIEIGSPIEADFLGALLSNDKEPEKVEKNNIATIDDNEGGFLKDLGITEEGETKKEDTAEEVEKEVVEELVSETKEEEVIEQNTNEEGEVDYENIISVLISSGEWEEFELEDQEGKITKETFDYIKKEQQKIKEEKLRKSAFSKDEQEFLEFKKNGGDIKAYADSLNKIQLVDDKLDITTDEGKKIAIATYYKNVIGWNDERINKHISRLEKDLELDEEAEMADKEIKGMLKENHDKLVKEAAERSEKIKKENEEYEKTLKETVKNKKYDTKQVNQIVKDVIVKDEKGLAEVDKKYIELRNNPELIADLWEYFFNKEKLVEKIKREATTENNKETFKKIVFGKKGKQTKAGDTEENKKGEVVIPI